MSATWIIEGAFGATSVQLQYHGKLTLLEYFSTIVGYQGEAQDKGAKPEEVEKHLNGLFSLVQGLGGTAVVRTYIDQLAQVLSALVGWSKIDECKGNGGSCNSQKDHGTKEKCKYLDDVMRDDRSCETCGCIKGGSSSHLGRGCTRCMDSGDTCKCSTPGSACEGDGKECQCAKAGKCCKCCCKGCSGKCSDSCICHKDGYMSAYPHTSNLLRVSFVEDRRVDVRPYWKDLVNPRGYYPGSASERRHQCAQTLLGSVCLIWSGITYMYWTGKYAKSSPRWSNHILDGSGLDDGTLSQWLQALGFPREMLNDKGPDNRLDQVINNDFVQKFYLGFVDTSSWSPVHGQDNSDNSFRNPGSLNTGGFIHEINKGAFGGSVFESNGNGTDQKIDQNKLGPLFKLYILSCAYFTGLQKKTPPKAGNTTPKTIRDILYWLSALPYSQAYSMIMGHCKKRLDDIFKISKQEKLSFTYKPGAPPFTVERVNLYAHFQAVTQYCPLVLIGIQGGIHSAEKTTEPAIHSLYANTECSFTYPTVSIQAYNQVVHYIRALFYQLYFLRKQCAVKVALGGKWRECRYGDGVLGKDVVSWMCLGCNPMEHDRKTRMEKVKGELGGMKTGGDPLAGALKNLLEKIGDVVVLLGNAQEALEGKKGEGIKKVKDALGAAKTGLEGAKDGLRKATDIEFADALGNEELKKLTDKDGKAGLLVDLTKNGGNNGILKDLDGKLGNDSSGAKDKISDAINGVREALEALKEWAEKKQDDELNGYKNDLLSAIEKLKDICTSPKCPSCKDHANKCGKTPVSKYCDKCHQQYMDGTPSPLQAFLEDRLPGFSCDVVPAEDNPTYPPAASHLWHSNNPGQCCPLPMGFRGQFHKGNISDCTGARLYGILYFFCNDNMMQSCVYRLVRVTSALSATTPQVLGDVFGFFRGGVGEKERGKPPKEEGEEQCGHIGSSSEEQYKEKYFCGWCASGLRDEVKQIEWIPNGNGTPGGQYLGTVGQALIEIKGDKDASGTKQPGTTSLSALTKDSEYLSPLTGELYTAVSATFGGTYLSWVLYLSDALQWGLKSLASEFKQIECRGCKGQCDPNKCKKGKHGQKAGEKGTALCQCPSIVSCTGVLPVLYRHGFSYGNPFNLEGYQQKGEKDGDYSIENKDEKTVKHCHEFLDSLNKVLENKQNQEEHPLTNLLTQVGQLQYDIRLPWIFVLTLAWLVAVLYLAFGAIWPLDWTHMRSHWLRGGEHQWQCMWYKVMTGRKGMELVEYFVQSLLLLVVMV